MKRRLALYDPKENQVVLQISDSLSFSWTWSQSAVALSWSAMRRLRDRPNEWLPVMTAENVRLT
jgi:hypothetical protein